MNKKHYDDVYKLYYQDILNRDSLNAVRKFHQLTTIIADSRAKKDGTTKQLSQWLELTEWKTTTPKKYNSFIPLYYSSEGTSSSRIFKKDCFLNLSDLAEIFGGAFSANEYMHRPFPSAGALFGVLPILIILKDEAIEELKAGVYYYDSIDKGLYSLKIFSDENSRTKAASLLFPSQGKNLDIPSNYCVAYVGDFQKVILKYHELGYKHLLLETGMMAQSFRHSLNKWKERAADLSYSGYMTNALSDFLGFDKDQSPVLLVQWFGIRYDKNK